MKTDLDTKLAAVAGDYAGAFRLDHFLALGGDADTAKRRARSGYWIREGMGLFRLRDAPATRMQALWVALHEAGDDSVLSHGTAARELGHQMFATYEDIDVTLLRGGNHHCTHSRLHETSWLPVAHVVDVNGLRATSIARCMFDLAGAPLNPAAFRNDRARWAHLQRMKYMANHAMSHLGLTIADMVSVLADLSRSGRPGGGVLRELLDEWGPDYVPTESELEDMFLSVVRAFGIEEPVKQSEYAIEVAGIVRVDFLFLDAKLIVEVDGRWHDAPLQAEADRWRDNEFGAMGYRVLRFRWRDLKDHPERVARILLAALAAARP